METRPFGRTGHHSTVAIFGAFAVSQATQAEADATVERVIAAGVNHIDVAPSYGDAEARLGPWMKRARARFFLGCKTMERTAAGARAELEASLKRLQVDSFDLYQIHAITSFDELDSVTAPGGALEGLLAARQEGLTRYIGITGHGHLAPAIFLEALRRFDFDSVLFPLNFVLFGDPDYRQAAEELLRQCRLQDVGTMVIKAVARQPWGEGPQTHLTWYQPFTQPEMVQRCVDFVLSHDVTGLCTVGDPQLLPSVLQACENFSPLTAEQQQAQIAQAVAYATIF